MLKALKQIAAKSAFGLYHASTKITAVFCTAIAVTVAGGGAYTLFSSNSTPQSYEEDRSPASMNESALHSISRPPNFNANPSFSSQAGNSSSMPANYAARTNAQDNREGAVPVDIIQPADTSAAQSMQSVLAKSLASREQISTASEANTSTSTATEQTGVGGAGGAGGTNTATNTTIATTNGVRAFSLSGSQTGWTGVCQAGAITLLDSTLLATTTTESIAFFLTTTAGGFFSDAGCTNAITTITFDSGLSGGNFYFNSDAAASATVTIYNSSLGTETATITVDQASASFALGQPNLVSNIASNGGDSGSSLNTPKNSFRLGSRLFVADSASHRVLVWNNAPTTNAQSANYALGQPDLITVTENTGGLSAQSLKSPSSIHSDGTRLFVADSGNNRVLIWNSIPTTNQQAADLVIGQPNLTSNTANNGGISAATLESPQSVFYNGAKLIVSDATNHRVLVWNTIPSIDGVAADLILGQPDATTNTSGATASKFNTPRFVYATTSKLYVSDFANHRVLIYSSFPTATGQAANLAMGQADLTSAVDNSGGVSASSLSGPVGITVDAQGRLFVADNSNNRVLIWNKEPSATNAVANGVLGQANFTTVTTNTGGVSASSSSGPWGIDSSGSDLWLTENANHRTLKFTIP